MTAKKWRSWERGWAWRWSQTWTQTRASFHCWLLSVLMCVFCCCLRRGNQQACMRRLTRVSCRYGTPFLKSMYKHVEHHARESFHSSLSFCLRAFFPLSSSLCCCPLFFFVSTSPTTFRPLPGSKFVGYSNSDILYCSELVHTLRAVLAAVEAGTLSRRVLVVGKRYNFNMPATLDDASPVSCR